MNRGRLKRRISPCKNFGKEDDSRPIGNVNPKRFCHLTGIQISDHEITKDEVADKYESYLVQENSVATSLTPSVKCDTAVVANLLTCISPFESDGNLWHLDDFNSSLRLPRTGELDETNASMNGIRQLSRRDLDSGVFELPVVPLVTEHLQTYNKCALDEFCQICKKDISCCDEQQHKNRCIDEMENTEQEKKHLEETTDILFIQQVLNCPFCGKTLKAQNARHIHLKQCAARFCISPMDFIELIKKQEQDHQIQLLSNSLQQTSEELAMAKRKSALAKKKRKRVVKNRFEEPHSKLEEDTQLAIALSTSIEDRRKSLAGFVSYLLPVIDKQKEEVTDSPPPLIDHDPDPLPRSSKDAFLLLMSQKTKESSLSTIRGKKNKVEKQLIALLALDQDEVKRRLAEKATALVLEQSDISAFYKADTPCFRNSWLSAKYCHKRSKDFLWCLATHNTEKLCNYYVKELVHPIVPRDAAYSSFPQKNFNRQMSDERPERSLLNPTVTSVLYGSTQTALVLAELAAEAGTETSFAEDFSQKSLCNYQEMLKEPLPSAAAANGFYIATDEVCEKASTDLLNAWSQMVDNDSMSDLTLDCRDGEVVHLHRLVIMARYPNLLQILESGSSTKVFSQFSKIAALSVVRFIYSADTDVCHSVVFEAKRLAESLQLTEFCKICENVVNTYDLIEPTVPEASSATVEELVACSWSDGLDLMQRDTEDSCGGGGKAVEKEEAEDTDLDEVSAFMLTQRSNQMNRGGITEDKYNEDDTSKSSLEDKEDSLIRIRSYSGSDDGSEDVLSIELSPAASSGDELTKVISSEQSHEVMGHVSCDLTPTSEECVLFGAKTFPYEIPSEERECISVHVEPSGGKNQQRSDSFRINSLSKSSNRTTNLVATEDESDRCLCEDDDEKDILPQKSGEEMAPAYSVDKTSCLVSESCVSFDISRTDTEHPLDSPDVCPVDSFNTRQHGEKEPMMSCTLILPLKSVSSSPSSFCSSRHSFVPSSDTISKHANDLISTRSSDNLSPDLFLPSPCSESFVSSGQELSVLQHAAKKLKTILDTDEDLREAFERRKSVVDYKINLSTLSTLGSGSDIERQSDAKCEKCGLTVPTFKMISNSSTYLQKSILETRCHSKVHGHCFSQESLLDAEHHFLLEMGENLTDDDLLPDLDHDDGNVQNPAETNGVQSPTSAFLNNSENDAKNNCMINNNNEIDNSLCSDDVLFPNAMKTLNLSPDVEIGKKSSKINGSLQNCLDSPSKSSPSCRINLSVVTDKVKDYRMSDDKTSEETQNTETSDEEYSEKKRHSSCDDVAHYAANDDDYDEKNNATQCIPIQCDDDEVLTAGFNSDEENILENLPEEEFRPHASFKNEINASHMCLGAMTPKSVKMREQSTVGQLNYSPPTDMETDVSALMEDVITNSSLLNSDVSFETSDGPARTVIDANSPVINKAKQVNSEFADTPVTPLPSYGQMNTPALQQHCRDYGIRRLPKKRMVGVLENIFFELHPDIPKPDLVKPKQHANKKTKAVAKRGNLASFLPNESCNGNHLPAQQEDSWNIIRMPSHPPAITSTELSQGRRSLVAKQTTTEILKFSDSESDNYLESKQEFSDDEDEEESSLEMAENRKKIRSGSQSIQDDSLKKEILMSFFSKSTDLYQRILNYEPLELVDLRKLLKEKEIKVSSHFLIDFLDEQNILFTTRNNRAVCNSRRLPCKGKIISRPSTLSEQHS